MASTSGIFLIGLGLIILCIASLICLFVSPTSDTTFPIIMSIYGSLSIIAGLDFIVKKPKLKDKNLSTVEVSRRDGDNMATAFGGFLTGIGLCFLIIIPAIWYYVWNHYYYCYIVVVESRGTIIPVEGPPSLSNITIPAFFGGILIIIGMYCIVRAKRPPREEKELPLPPPPPPMPKQIEKRWRSQFRCNACGQIFWIDEHRIRIPYCPQCGAPNPKVIANISSQSSMYQP